MGTGQRLVDVRGHNGWSGWRPEWWPQCCWGKDSQVQFLFPLQQGYANIHAIAKKKKNCQMFGGGEEEGEKNPWSNPRRKQINVSEEPNQVKIPPLFRLWWFKSQIFCLLLLGAQEFKCGPARFSGARCAALVPLAAPLPSSVWLFSSPPTRFLSFSFVADIVKAGLAFEGRRRLWSTSVWNYDFFFLHLFFSSYWTKIIVRYNRFQRSGFLCSANRLFLYFILLMLPTESKHW